jgi:hypothetical protein
VKSSPSLPLLEPTTVDYVSLTYFQAVVIAATHAVVVLAAISMCLPAYLAYLAYLLSDIYLNTYIVITPTYVVGVLRIMVVLRRSRFLHT